MSKRRSDPADQPETDRSVVAGQGGEAVGRTARGCFAPGHTGNPKGRPRKGPSERAPAIVDLLFRLLEEKVPGGAAGPKSITMAEAMLRTLLVKGCKDPQVALALLRFASASAWSTEAEEEPQDVCDADDEVLRRYFERQSKRAARSVENAAKASDDEDEAGGS